MMNRIRKIETIVLESPPVWDGIITAYGKVFIALKNGKVLCIGI